MNVCVQSADLTQRAIEAFKSIKALRITIHRHSVTIRQHFRLSSHYLPIRKLPPESPRTINSGTAFYFQTKLFVRIDAMLSFRFLDKQDDLNNWSPVKKICMTFVLYSKCYLTSDINDIEPRPRP